jgi:hypothetical protein
VFKFFALAEVLIKKFALAHSLAHRHILLREVERQTLSLPENPSRPHRVENVL